MCRHSPIVDELTHRDNLISRTILSAKALTAFIKSPLPNWGDVPNSVENAEAGVAV